MKYKNKKYTRPDLEIISNLIPADSSVLDLGCGAGELLHDLIHSKNVKGQGIELDSDLVFKCVSRGVPVIHQDLDEALKEYSDRSFDYVILSQTLQQVNRPDHTLVEMLRVGRYGIVGLLNFGHWRVRHYLTLHGRMPKSKTLPYEWYNTPNIHLSTIRDFQMYCRQHQIRILKQINLVHRRVGALLPRLFPNSFANLSVFVVENETVK
ncbi:MAG: methionine biosynthesis protein MetW [candidate division KSB1 bacterium]|nr:methionine biosynthesis protein MetW [candidate division KSB1 bacterium]